MEREITITLKLKVEDSAIVCSDDPDMVEHVKQGFGGDEEAYVKWYVKTNFDEAFNGKDQGAYENIVAYVKECEVEASS